MKSTITPARANLGQLRDKIERTKTPVILSRQGHEDMTLLPAAELERLQGEAIAPLLALLGTDIVEHPERLQKFPEELIARMKQLTSGVAIDHAAAISGAVAAFDQQVAPTQDPAVWAKTRHGLMAKLEQGASTSRPPRKRPRKGTSG